MADGSRYRIRKVSSSGIINTIAGVGTPGYSGDNGDPLLAQICGSAGIAVSNSGDVFFADDPCNYRIRMITTRPLASEFLGLVKEEIEVFPNPCVKNFRIKINSAADELINIVVSTVTGAQVYECTALSNLFEIQPNLPSGIYFIRVTSEHCRFNQVIIMQ